MATSSHHELDDLTPHQLIAEIKQIAEQYSREVTTARRTWPKSVKDRVLALARMGVASSRISQECGIPTATVFLWCKQIPSRRRRAAGSVVMRETRFLALHRSDTCNSNPTVGMGVTESALPQSQLNAAIGLQLLLPGGIEVRGLTSIDQVLSLYRGCRV